MGGRSCCAVFRVSRKVGWDGWDGLGWGVGIGEIVGTEWERGVLVAVAETLPTAACLSCLVLHNGSFSFR